MAELVPARYYARLGDVLRDMGIDTSPLLQRAGLQATDFQGTDAGLTIEQIEKLVMAAIKESGRSDLSLLLAKALKLTSHDVVSNGILSSPTVGYALRFVSRFFSLILPSFRMNYSIDNEYMQVTVVPVMPQSASCLAFHLELIAAAIYWEVKELLKVPVPPYNLYFSFREPPHVAAYAQFKEVKVHFGWHSRPGMSICCPAAMASEPLSMSDSQALELAEQRCCEMVTRSRLRDNLAEWVYMMLRESKDGMPSMQELADALSMSTRTLDRHLKKYNTTFRELSSQAIDERACDLLQKGRQSITDIALELGYSDASNFARAFRRSMGMSPKEWQQRQH